MPNNQSWPEMAAMGAVPGAGEWLALSDELLAGLVHALNNRVTALSVCAELAGLGDEEMLAGGVLLTEVARLQRASALIGSLPARGHAAEALEIGPVLDDAIAIHALHARMRTIGCTLKAVGTVLPVRAPRWALLRLLLLLVDAAKTAAQSAGRTDVELQLQGVDHDVQVRAIARGTGGAYAAQMAALCGGSVSREGDQLVISLPSLPELRRRERMARAAG
jgi:hypothetical protein